MFLSKEQGRATNKFITEYAGSLLDFILPAKLFSTYFDVPHDNTSRKLGKFFFYLKILVTVPLSLTMDIVVQAQKTLTVISCFICT